MKKTFLFLAALFAVVSVYAAFVPQDKAEQVASLFYRQYDLGNGLSPRIGNVITKKFESLSTFYIINFQTGGFVIIAAEDASIPILGYSGEGSVPEEITNPSLKFWLDSYSQEISKIIKAGLSNKETLKEWNAIGKGKLKSSLLDVNPLLNTTWDQGCYYNALCPADAGAFFSCGHVYTGCVATCMAQIMKYHNFPPQGVGSHSYTHPTYGVQTADFGNTLYNFPSMPNNVGSPNTAVATLMYHAGVSVDMQYGVNGSGAFSEDVPYALINYFNYRPEAAIYYKNNYANVEDFKNLIRADLDQQLPLYYSGDGPGGGHAFVCDGYRMSDGTFHFNWGWSGSSNGWYTIGNLNPGGSTFNNNNAVVAHIKPYNPNLIVRIEHPVNNAVIGVGYSVQIKAVTVRGTPTMMKIFIDSIEKASTTSDSLIFTWYTSTSDLGSHEVKAFSYSATDTVFYRINLNVAEWISQSSAFPTISRGISYMSAVDSNYAWGTAYDATNPTGACSDFTRTTNGGAIWKPGVITNTTGLASAMIFAVSGAKAYVPMYKVSGSKPQGIYMTADSGTTWTRQTSAGFTTASFPDCVHFFNENDGWCLGDPVNNSYEIYTTNDGGTNWVQVSGSNIPNPLSGEYGIVGYYSAVHDTVWFGTNKGRVYRSVDKGYNWTVANVPALTGKYIKPTFRNGNHGLSQDKDAGTTGAICETFDGGLTWTPVTTTGTIYATDLAYVPGTENTWVSSGANGTNGSSYSFDGGHTWSDFAGTSGAEYMQMAWVNNHCGWAGGVNTSTTENGVYKFIGVLMQPLPVPTNLQANVAVHDVHLTWEPPQNISSSLNLLGYNIYRDGLLLNTSPVTILTYDDTGLTDGEYTYCVKAVYSQGESAGICTTVDVLTGIINNESSGIRVYPNPATSHISITSTEKISDVRIFNSQGMMVKSCKVAGNSISVDLSSFTPGIYSLKVTTALGISIVKLVKR